jgi:hypothetical protein
MGGPTPELDVADLDRSLAFYVGSRKLPGLDGASGRHRLSIRMAGA